MYNSEVVVHSLTTTPISVVVNGVAAIMTIAAT